MSGDIRGQPDSDSEVIQEKLEDLKVRYGFREPERGNLDDPDIVWRFGKPDYTKANYQFLKSKTQNHAEGWKHLLEKSFAFLSSRIFGGNCGESCEDLGDSGFTFPGFQSMDHDRS